jgi:ABC-type sugar transport system substrate-binding protein
LPIEGVSVAIRNDNVVVCAAPGLNIDGTSNKENYQMGARTTKRVLAGLAAASLLVATNVLPASAEDQKTVGFSPIAWAIPAMVGIQGGFNGIAASMGLKTANAPDPNFDSATAKKNIESWITNKTVDGFWSITPGVPSTLKSTLELAQEKGVAAVVNGVPADYGFSGLQKGISFAVIDYAKQGTQLGIQMGKCMVAKKLSTSSIIMGVNPAGTIGKKEMEAAFKLAFQRTAPKAKIVRSVSLTGDQAKQQSTIRTAIQAAPKAVGIVTWTDEGALGSIAAYKTAGKKPASLCLVGAGGGDQAKAAVKAKNLYADVALDFGADIAQNIIELKRLMAGTGVMGKQLVTPVVVYNQ